METFDIMSRASVVPVHVGQQPLKNVLAPKTIIFTSQHVTHPMRWENCYPRDQYPWLEFVHDHHMKYQLEVRDSDNGKLYRHFPVSIMDIHPVRDMSLLRIDNEQSFFDYLESEDYKRYMVTEVDDLLLDLYPHQVHEDQYVQFKGFELAGSDDEKSMEDTLDDATSEDSMGETDQENLLPKLVHGHVNMIDIGKHRVFARTANEPVSMGMCGGPVLVRDEAHGGKMMCAGMLEGLVSGINDPKLNHLQGNAVFIPSTEMKLFMEQTLMLIK